MDWYHEGQVAALNGFNMKQGKTPFIDKCQEDHGVAIDNVDFERGFKSGLNKLCSPEGFKALAAKGAKYQEICQNDEEAQAIMNPSPEQVLKNRVEHLESEIARLKKENVNLEAEVDSCKVGQPQ